MADQEATGMSKSAKRRAAKKLREAGDGEAPAAAAAAPVANKENAAGDANKSAAAALGAKPKAKAAAEPAPAAKAKAKAEPKAEPKAAPKPADTPKPKADAKPKATAAKAKAKPAPPPPPVEEKKKEPEVDPFITFDDGTGGDWEVATAVSKKQQSRQARKEEEKKMMVDIKLQTQASKIPGMSPGQTIPGMAPVAAGKAVTVQPAASQLVTAAPAAAGTAAEEAATTKADLATATVKVPEARIGIVIGPKGAKIKQIQEKTGVTRIDTSGELFTITGKAADVERAKQAIEDLVEKGYTALTYENFSENHIMVHPSHFPDIIGKQGAIIRKLKDELGVEVTIPPTPKTGNINSSPKKYKVTVAGTREGVDKAKEVINDIMTYYHHEITHPGEVHEEVEIEEWQYPFIIGKGGCEMRHVQKSYHVRMYIPRETSTNKNVVLVGDKGSVERAKAYVQRQLDNSWTASRGRDRQDKADDGWGDEEEEDWMKQYMYKR